MKKALAVAMTVIVRLSFAGEIPLPTEGLIWQLDAADLSTLSTNEYGQVTNWVNKVNSEQRFYSSEMADATYAAAPWYNPAAFGGRGGLEFGYPPGVNGEDYTTATWSKRICTRLRSSATIANRTIAVVLKQHYYNSSAMLRFYGQWAGGSGTVVTYSYGRWSYGNDRYFDGRVFSSRDWAAKSPAASYVCYPETDTYTYYDYMRRPLVLVDVRSTTYTSAMCIGNHYQLEKDSCLRGVVGELLVYDRELSYEETMQLTDYLQEKWFGHGVCVWQGPSRGTPANWNDPSNWKDEKLPGANDHVLIRNATVNVSGLARADSLLLEDADLNLTTGADLAVSNLATFAASGFSMTDAKFSLLAFARARAQKTVPLVPEGGSALLKGANTIVTARGMNISLARTTVSGRLTKAGPATLFCTDDGQLDGISLHLGGGLLDLNGTTQKLAAATGGGGFVNSAEDEVELTVEATGDSALEPSVGERIRVSLKGGDLALSGLQPYAGATTLAGGRVAVTTNVTPMSIAGLTLHLDASDVSSVQTDELGRVEKWFSGVKVCNGGCPPQDQHFSGYSIVTLKTSGVDDPAYSAPVHRPLYCSKAFNGRPAVVFGRTPDGSFTNTHVAAEVPYSNQTVIVVLQVTNVTHKSFGSIYGNFGSSGDNAIRLNNYSKTEWLVYNSPRRARINGNTVYDRSLETPGSVDSKNYGGTQSPQVLVFEWQSPYVQRIAIGMTSSTYYTRAFEGAIHEVIAYDRLLTDNELHALETSLMEKWDVTVGAEKGAVVDTLPVRSALTVTADASLGLGGREQTIPSLTLDAGTGVRYPSLALDGAYDISKTDLLLAPVGLEPKSETLITTPAGMLTGGQFKTSPTLAPGYRLRITGSKVRLAEPSLLMFVK